MADEVHLDSWVNLLSGLGGALDARATTRLVHGSALTQGDIDALYQDDDIAARIVDAIPDHATRRWITVKTEPSDVAKEICDALEDIDASARFAEWLRRDRKDGGALLVIGADDGQDPSKPLDMRRVAAVRHLHVLERWQVTRSLELEQDPSKRWFGTPTSYRLHASTPGGAAGQEIHASRVFALHGVRVSELVQREQGGWGMSVLQRVREPLASFRTTWGYLGASMKRFSETWLRMKGLRELVAADKGNVVKARLAVLSAMRSSLKIAPIDADDDVKELGLQLAGMDGLILRAMDVLAGAAEMPLTVLFGHAPSGLSTDDESGKRNWYDRVALVQRRQLLRPINELIEILLAAKDAKLPRPERWQVSFCPLEEPTDEEVAAREKTRAETHAIYIQTQVLDPAEVRDELRADPRSPFALRDGDLEPPAPEPAPMPAQPQPAQPSAAAAGPSEA